MAILTLMSTPIDVRKGVIAKMTYLVEFWVIIESDLVERAPHGIFLE